MKDVTKKENRGSPDIAELGKPYRFKAGPKQVEIARRGGKALKGNPNVILAAKLRHLREKGFTDKTKERLFELLQNKEFSRIDMLNYLEKIRKQPDLDVETQLRVLAAIKDVSKMLHGTKENDRRVAVAHIVLTPEERQANFIRLTEGNDK